ncbi:1471_t:CDS:2, partial [Ambispora leptoticha]
LLLNMVKLIKKKYGPKKITPNLHLCLNICECVNDYGPMYAFWCFSYERMNGLLGSFYNSNRKIEIELFKTIQSYSLLEELTKQAEGHFHTCLQFIKQRTTKGSLFIQNENDRYEFLSMSRNIEESSGTGVEPFSGEILGPKNARKILSKEISDILTKYYNNAYNYSFKSLNDRNIRRSESIPVLPRVTEFGKVKISDEIFGSTSAAKQKRLAKILAKFILANRSTDIYPGIVQFYFEHVVQLPEGPKKHVLVFVHWFKPVDNHKIRYHCQVDDICNIELWNRNFYNISRDCIIPIHNILGRFISGTVKVGKKNLIEYMSVIPVNRKFHI